MNIVNQKEQLDELHKPLKKVEGEDVNPIPKQGFFKRFIRTARKTLAGETLAGRIGRIAKNIIKPFIPFGRQIDAVTDEIGDSLKTEKKTMANETIFQKIIRFLKQPSTRDGAAVLVLVLGALFGLDIDPEALTSSLLGVVTGIAGVWVSVKSLIGIFKDEDA